MDKSRRNFVRMAGITGGAFSVAAVSKYTLANLPEPVERTDTNTQPPYQPEDANYNPVVTLNGWT